MHRLLHDRLRNHPKFKGCGGLAVPTHHGIPGVHRKKEPAFGRGHPIQRIGPGVGRRLGLKIPQHSSCLFVRVPPRLQLGHAPFRILRPRGGDPFRLGDNARGEDGRALVNCRCDGVEQLVGYARMIWHQSQCPVANQLSDWQSGLAKLGRFGPIRSRQLRRRFSRGQPARFQEQAMKLGIFLRLFRHGCLEIVNCGQRRCRVGRRVFGLFHLVPEMALFRGQLLQPVWRRRRSRRVRWRRRRSLPASSPRTGKPAWRTDQSHGLPAAMFGPVSSRLRNPWNLHSTSHGKDPCYEWRPTPCSRYNNPPLASLTRRVVFHFGCQWLPPASERWMRRFLWHPVRRAACPGGANTGPLLSILPPAAG